MTTLTRDELEAAVLRGTGTEFGIHRSLRAGECGRKAQLSSRTTFIPALGRDAGTIWHRMLAHYHTGQVVDVPFIAPDWPLDWLTVATEEAWRLFNFYETLAGPDRFGRPLAAEISLAGTLPGVDGPRTGQVDLLVEDPPFDDTPPGVYLVDHKSMGQKDADMHLRYQFDLQPSLYMYLYKQQTGVEPQGMIINGIVRHKKLTAASTVRLTVPFPSDERIIQIAEFLAVADAREAEGARNLSACFGKYGACEFLLTTCGRS